MANEKDSLHERGRSLEADYFRRRDQELLERAREQEAEAEHRRQLTAALGVADADDPTVAPIVAPIVATLRQLGFEPGTVALLNVVPAIQVAWADGSLPDKERVEIERILARPEIKAAAGLGSGMVAEWLSRQPSADLYRLAIEVLQLQLARLDPEARTRMITTILGECNAVAGASGGVFGIGTHSSVESERIKELAAALGVSS